MRIFHRRSAASLCAALCAATVASACGTSDGADGGRGGSAGEACGEIVPNGKGGILPPPDGAAACPAGACNYQSQEGCAEDEACRPYYPAGSTTVTPKCEAFGAGRSGETCSLSSDCARGFLCIEDAPGVKTCHKQCCGSDFSACDPGESCIRQFKIQFMDGHQEYAGDFCMPVGTCDPLEPDSCKNEPGRECKIVDPTGAVACMPKSTAELGDSCSPPSVCAQGLTCVGTPDTGLFCRRLCRAEQCGQPACPEAEGTCVHFDRDPPGVGECTPGW